MFAKSTSYKNGQKVTLNGYYSSSWFSAGSCGQVGDSPVLWEYAEKDKTYAKYFGSTIKIFCSPAMGQILKNIPKETEITDDFYGNWMVQSGKTNMYTVQTQAGNYMLLPSKKFYANLMKKYPPDTELAATAKEMKKYYPQNIIHKEMN